MKIAVTFEKGNVFQHFGHTETFKVYEVENKKVISSKIVTATEGGHSALATLLADNKIDALICGGIGGGAQTALKENGIQLYGGVSGNADSAVEAFLKEELSYNPEVKCNHFEQDHEGEANPHCHSADGCKHNCK